MVSDLFEKIVLWENRAESATVSRLPDGRWQVRVKVHAKKLEADEIGREKELPLDDWIDVGVLDKNDAPLAMEKRHITRPQEEMTFVVAGEPARAGIDPWVHLIDRRWSDNTISVSR